MRNEKMTIPSKLKETQKRKKYAAKGERTSKMVSFRADEGTTKILDLVANKGRLINRLVQEWGRKHKVYDDPDAPPEENSIEEYFT